MYHTMTIRTSRITGCDIQVGAAVTDRHLNHNVSLAPPASRLALPELAWHP